MREGLIAAIAYVTLFFEVIGIVVILGGLAVAVSRAGASYRQRHNGTRAYHLIRSIFGRSLLLGLEILVAADLIRTVAIEPNLNSLYVLGLLVLVRTFLSFSLDIELEGAWPWQKRLLEDRETVHGIKRDF